MIFFNDTFFMKLFVCTNGKAIIIFMLVVFETKTLYYMYVYVSAYKGKSGNLHSRLSTLFPNKRKK